MAPDSLRSLYHRLVRPTDPATLGLFRICFGWLMLHDLLNERGCLAFGAGRRIDPDSCWFPLFHGMPLPSVDQLHLVCAAMTFSTVLFALGLFYRLASTTLALGHWYLFILDKTRWNNHSYLFGLAYTMFAVIDAQRWASLDGLLWPNSVRNHHIPSWQLWVFRFQQLILYFVAGLKKATDMDWMSGESLDEIHRQNVFRLPMSVLRDALQLTEHLLPGWFTAEPENIVGIFIHHGGVCFDLSIGWMLLHPKTRLLAIPAALFFHVMNNQMFEIGQFPITCIALLSTCFDPSWPRVAVAALKAHLPAAAACVLPQTLPPRRAANCAYYDDDVNDGDEAVERTLSGEVGAFPGLPRVVVRRRLEPRPNDRARGCVVASASGSLPPRPRLRLRARHRATLLLLTLYVGGQLFLPYSHFLTRGYNTWVQGMYGYSWDMMIKTWELQHVRIRLEFDPEVEGEDAEVVYLEPNAYAVNKRRWHSHPDMLKQYAQCILGKIADPEAAEGAESEGMRLTVDVWLSMNNRFKQRLYDPEADLWTVGWHPLRDTEWILPLQLDKDEKRRELRAIETRYRKDGYRTTFVADFPGFKLENFVNAGDGFISGFANLTFVLLEGEVDIELETFDPDTNVRIAEEELYYHTSDSPVVAADRALDFIADPRSVRTKHEAALPEEKNVRVRLPFPKRMGERFRVSAPINVSIPLNMTHVVHTVGDVPATWMYASFHNAQHASVRSSVQDALVRRVFSAEAAEDILASHKNNIVDAFTTIAALETGRGSTEDGSSVEFAVGSDGSVGMAPSARHVQQSTIAVRRLDAMWAVASGKNQGFPGDWRALAQGSTAFNATLDALVSLDIEERTASLNGVGATLRGSLDQGALNIVTARRLAISEVDHFLNHSRVTVESSDSLNSTVARHHLCLVAVLPEWLWGRGAQAAELLKERVARVADDRALIEPSIVELGGAIASSGVHFAVLGVGNPLKRSAEKHRHSAALVEQEALVRGIVGQECKLETASLFGRDLLVYHDGELQPFVLSVHAANFTEELTRFLKAPATVRGSLDCTARPPKPSSSLGLVKQTLSSVSSVFGRMLDFEAFHFRDTFRRKLPLACALYTQSILNLIGPTLGHPEWAASTSWSEGLHRNIAARYHAG